MSDSAEKMNECLRKLLKRGRAQAVLLITKEGQMLTSVGDVGFINTTALSALVAGMFAATCEVAKLIGESEFSILFQQGVKRNIHISLIAAYAMMIIVYEEKEKTGLIHFQAAQIAKELIPILSEETKIEIKIEDYKVYASHLIDEIFKEE